MASLEVADSRFVRRTTLNQNEYRTNFRQIDCDVIEVLTSLEADRVTSQMSKIYLRLTNAPKGYWEREGVLRLAGEEREGKWLTAWEQLISLSGVASATARKAISWMSQQGIIGYFAGKNGVGIRIFFNRATSSIRQRSGQYQKNLRLIQASVGDCRTSVDEVVFKESLSDRENLELDLIPLAPKNGAANEKVTEKLPSKNHLSGNSNINTIQVTMIESEATIERVVKKILPRLVSEARRGQEQTREWFIKDALPKAVRVAQSSAYDILRTYGVINKQKTLTLINQDTSSDRNVGKHTKTAIVPSHLRNEEIKELAESSLALMATQGQSIDRIISEMGIEAGGFLLPEDALKVQALAESLMLDQKVIQDSRRKI